MFVTGLVAYAQLVISELTLICFKTKRSAKNGGSRDRSSVSQVEQESVTKVVIDIAPCFFREQ